VPYGGPGCGQQLLGTGRQGVDRAAELLECAALQRRVAGGLRGAAAVAVEAGTGWMFVCQAFGGGGRHPGSSGAGRDQRAAGATSAVRRLTARTPAGCARWRARLGCRRPYPRTRTCASGGPALGCARRRSMSARVAAASPGHADSSRHRGRPGQAGEPGAAPSSTRSSCPTPHASGSEWRLGRVEALGQIRRDAAQLGPSD
jgi:hypothetical protein